MNIVRFIFSILLAATIWTVGCTTTPHPDPLAGWQFDFSRQPNRVIEKDYRNYIQKLSPEEEKYAGPIHTFIDGTGRHAVRITIGLNGTSWQHVLIYDKDNKRIKTIKYSSGGYQS
jgi:hypothetical protein